MSLVNLPTDSTIGSLPILSPANLPNYLNQGYVIPGYTTGNTYSHLMTLQFSGNDAVATIKFLLVNTENWIDYNTQYAEVVLKAGIRGNVSSGVKNVHMDCVQSKTINPSNIIAVATENDANGYTIDVYFNQQNSAGGARTYFLLPLYQKITQPRATKLTYYNNQAAIASLPAGTQTTCNGGSRDIISVYVYYASSVWNVQDFNYNNLATIIDPETAQYLYGTPTWSTDCLLFPSTSIVMNANTNLLGVTTGYVNGTTLAYEPVIVQGTARKIRFINRSTGAIVTTPDTSMNCVLTYSRLR